MADFICVGIIEDDLLCRQAQENILNLSATFRLVGSWGDAESAILAMPEILPDILLVDIKLPGIDGIECIRRLKKSCPHTLFLVVTTSEEDEHVFEALRAGASGYLIKTDGLDALIAGIKEAWAGGAPLSRNIACKIVRHFNHFSGNVCNNQLTSREREIIVLLAGGQTYKEIAAQLSISVETTKKHIKNIYAKLEVHSRTEAVNKWRLPQK
ncbi:LuxR family two component transcriptional regulator [Chitinophaga niastensis]|uniref:LuxR family two component transcriptional regulator n=1 Tax=Chitinophaga niastensis TaxID=536980 RepID=A0A2P8HA63_CHINA|nr:response regulator transcription factor [Chitinophaga niastensis]PSL43069.1 LuxR family two component transcriptional regulator [Chitinophaga niastensis]